MKAIYHQSTHSLEEMPEMKEPEAKDYYFNQASELFAKEEIYNEQKALCKTYPVVGEVKWVDGQILGEGKDFDIWNSKDARLLSDVIGIDHKPLPLKGQVAIPSDLKSRKLKPMKQIEELTDEDLLELWPAIGGAPHLFEYGKDELRSVLITGFAPEGEPIDLQLDYYTMAAIVKALKERGFETP